MSASFDPLAELRRRYVIASIYWSRLKETRPSYSPHGYIIEPWKGDGEPTYLPIEDAIQHGIYLGDNKYGTARILASKLAEDIHQSWTVRMPGNKPDCGPGIWICQAERASSEEIAKARTRQNAYANTLVMEARMWYKAGDKEQNIQERHRGAAVWLKLTDEPWLGVMHAEDMQKCPACRASIPADALVCMHCSRDVPQFRKLRQEADVLAAKDAATVAAKYKRESPVLA